MIILAATLTVFAIACAYLGFGAAVTYGKGQGDGFAAGALCLTAAALTSAFTAGLLL